MGYEADNNLYLYVGNDPLNRSDSSGLLGANDNFDDGRLRAMRDFAHDNPQIALPVGVLGAAALAAPVVSAAGTAALMNPLDATEVASGIAEGVAPGAGLAVGTGAIAQEVRAVSAEARAGPNFVVTPAGEAISVPTGAAGPTPTRAPGMQFTGGTGGGPGMDSRVTGVRVMDANSNQGARAVYMNDSGQTVNPATGRTVANSDPAAHQYLERHPK